MKDARLVKILVEEKAFVKLLKTIGRGSEYYAPNFVNNSLVADTDTNCF